MVVDLIRTPYLTEMRFFRNDPTAIPVLWFPAAPGAKLFPHRNFFSSRVWASDPLQPGGPAGEFPEGFRRGFFRRPPIPLPGQFFYGDPTWWMIGAPIGSYNPSIPVTWLARSEVCACAHVTSNFTNDFFESSTACSCSTAEGSSTLDLVVESSACSCSAGSSEIAVKLSTPCSCSTVTSSTVRSANFVSSSACSCSDMTSASPWPTFSACSCSTVTSSHVP